MGASVFGLKLGTDDLRENLLVRRVEARLHDAKRRYIEEEIPHNASVLCDTAEQIVSRAAVLIIGSATEDTRRVLAAGRPDQIVIDQTRAAYAS